MLGINLKLSTVALMRPRGPSGPQFFVSAAGSDNNDGKTAATAWASIDKVNAQTFTASTTIQFNGGDTFSGALVFTASNAPDGVKVASYGTGQATISSGNSAAAITATDVPNFGADGLICTGGGNTSNTTQGILVQNTGLVQLAGPTINGCTVTGYGQDGILVSCTQNVGFNNVNLTNNTVHDCTGKTGVFTCGINVNCLASSQPNPVTAFSNVTITGNTLFDLEGYASASNWTGTGVWLEGVTIGLVAHNLIHDVGTNSDTSTGPGGIATNAVDGITIQFNEVYNCFTANADGDGIDLDSDSINCVVQYNYVHDCAGFGLLGFNFGGATTPWANNTYRFNISVDCAFGFGIQASETGTTVQSGLVHNNTLMGQIGVFIANDCTMTWANNIIIGLDTDNPQIVQANTPSGTQVFSGNDYYGNGTFLWNGTTYDNLTAWQTATGLEKIGGVNVAKTVEPRLVVYGYSDTTNGYAPASLPQYQLQSGSPMLGGGVDITAQYGASIGPIDFFGVPIVSSSKVIGAGQQVAWAGASSATTTQAAAFLARTTGLDIAHQQQYNALISGLVADGIFSKLDALYKFATNSSVNALLNLVSTNYPLTSHGTLTFTADAGLQGDAATGYLSSTFTPSTAGGNYTLNSASWMFYPSLSRTDSTYYGDFGSGDGANDANCFMVGGNGPAFNINSIDTNTWFGDTPGDVKAMWLQTRTASNVAATYKNSASYNSVTVASSALPSQPFYILAANASGTASSPSADRIGYASWGAGLTAEEALLFSYRVNADAAALGINAF